MRDNAYTRQIKEIREKLSSIELDLPDAQLMKIEQEEIAARLSNAASQIRAILHIIKV